MSPTPAEEGPPTGGPDIAPEDAPARAALEATVPHHVPERAVALYARWWQLETWLRQLAHVELRALLGSAWEDAVKAAAPRRAQDSAYTHMTGADSDDPTAYLDYSQLVDVVQAHWPRFSYALLEEGAWRGRQDELKRIRHRIGHMRRPHGDDLGRLEQTLRDLERGAFIALASYNRRFEPDPARHSDAVTEGWVAGAHPDARRLIRHANRQYDTVLQVRASRRPWAVRGALIGEPGVLWHADFRLRDRTVDARALWHDSTLASVRPRLLHMLADDPWHVGFTFAAVDGGEGTADAIGQAFDAVLMVSRQTNLDRVDWDRWRGRATGLDFRVMTGTGWNIVDETTVPINVFGAGGGVEAAPSW
jgi:hypothetical protein